MVEKVSTRRLLDFGGSVSPAEWLWRGTLAAVGLDIIGTFFAPGNLTICLVCMLGLGLYCYLTRTHRYWADRGVSGPQPCFFFGTYLGQFFESFHISEEQRLKEFGPIYGIYEGTKPGLIVGDPNILKDIMVKDYLKFFNRRSVKTTHPVMGNFLSSLEDSPWTRVRGLIRKTFKPKELKHIYHLLHDSSLPLTAAVEDAARSGRDIDLKNLFGAYTMEVISRSCFAVVPNAEFVGHASSLFTFPFWRKFLDYVMPKWVLDGVGFTILPKEGMEFFRQITTQLIAQRLKCPEERHGDFVQLLLEARTSDGNGECSAKDSLSEVEILSQSVLFYSVGYETSSQLLTYCIYCLALNPDIQTHLREDIDQILEQAGITDTDNIPYDLLDQSEYLSAVIAETLRLYNPVLRMERKAAEDYPITDERTGNTIVIEKGMVVGVPVWALHHSAEYYPEPERFDPDRFLGEDEDGWKKRCRTKFANVPPGSPYLPFGIGPRNCIGTRFAIMETKLALLKILRAYRFTQTSATKVPLTFFPTGRPLLGPPEVLVGVEKL